MYAKQISSREYDELIRQSSFKEVLWMLKGKYPSLQSLPINADRFVLEETLGELLQEDMHKIYRLLDIPSQKLLQKYAQKYEIKYLKETFRTLRLGQVVNHIPTYLLTAPALAKAGKVSDVNTLLTLLKGTEYESVVTTYLEQEGFGNRSLFYLENRLDKHYFIQLYHFVMKQKEKNLIALVGKQIDLFNIQWSYRAKQFHGLTDQETEDIMIPIFYRLTKKMTTDLIKTSHFEDILVKTPYLSLSQNMDEMEARVARYLFSLYRSDLRKNAYDISTVISYLELKQIEIKNIITIMEGVRYGLPKEQIEQKIIT